jgi:hypothetical protein
MGEGRETMTMTEPGDTPTCGTGLAANAALPAKLGELLGATAEVLERHSAALDRTEPAGRAELEAYTALVRAHRAIARDLAALAQQMAGYRDLPVARHDEAVLADPAGQAAAFERLVAVERELLELLRARVEEGEQMQG